SLYQGTLRVRSLTVRATWPTAGKLDIVVSPFIGLPGGSPPSKASHDQVPTTLPAARHRRRLPRPYRLASQPPAPADQRAGRRSRAHHRRLVPGRVHRWLAAGRTRTARHRQTAARVGATRHPAGGSRVTVTA